MKLSARLLRSSQLVAICMTVLTVGALAQAANAVHPAPTPKPQPALPKPVFAVDPAPVTPTITCDKSPGAGLCYALSDVVTDYGNNCSGDAKCDAVWMAESGSDSSLDNQFEMDVLPSDVVSQQIGTLAFYVSLEICSQKRTGTDSYGYQSVVAEIKLLPRLLFLQKSAGITNPETCKESL